MQLSAALALILFQASTLALPTTNSDSYLQKRDGIPITIGFSDGTINWGTTSPVDVVNMLYDKCYGTGVCDSEPFTLSTTTATAGDGVWNSVTGSSDTLTITWGDSQYEVWVKNGLIEALADAVGAAMTTNTATLYSDCTVTKRDVTNIDERSPISVPIGVTHCDTTTVTQYTAPSSLQVTYQDPAGGVPSAITFYAAVQQNPDPLSGFCTTATGVGSAVGGVINGVLGAGFSLVGLVCGDI